MTPPKVYIENKFIIIFIIIQHHTFSVNCFRSFFTDFRLTESEISLIMKKGDIMIDKLSFYITDCHDPYTNLATEKYLLDCVSENEVILYLWQNQNTVVIGKNQNALTECKCTLLEADGGRLARRLSGGGSVFHDLGNLNFTFLCTTENYDLSRQMHVIKEACALAGISAEISGRNDILADGRKFSGNAFYNSKGKSYHHGTILVNADKEKLGKYLTPPKAKLEAKGVKSVKSRVINLSELNPALTIDKMKEYMVCAFEKVYGLSPVPFTLNDSFEISALAEKYASWEYLYAPSLPFTFSCEGNFPWGSIAILLDVKSGIIQSVQAFTDAMNPNLADKLKTALSGCLFRIDEMEKSILSNLPKTEAKDIAGLLKYQEI